MDVITQSHVIAYNEMCEYDFQEREAEKQQQQWEMMKAMYPRV